MRTIVAGVAVLAAALTGSATPARTAEKAECAVIASALVSGLENPRNSDPMFPKDVRPSSAWPRLGRDLSPYLKGFDLTGEETADLLRQSLTHIEAPWTPDCSGVGRPMVIKEGELVMTSSFTKPLFSSDGRIAVFSWGLHSPGPWAHGQTCLARRGQAGWKAVCRPSWLT